MNYLGLGTNEGLFWFAREAADSIWFLVMFAGALFAVGSLRMVLEVGKARGNRFVGGAAFPAIIGSGIVASIMGTAVVQRGADRPFDHSDDEGKRLQRADGGRHRSDSGNCRPDHAAGSGPCRFHHRRTAQQALRRDRACCADSRAPLHDRRDIRRPRLCAAQPTAQVETRRSTTRLILRLAADISDSFCTSCIC